MEAVDSEAGTAERIQGRKLRHDIVEEPQACEDPSFSAARATLMQWTEAVASGRVDDIVKLYAPDAILVPTLSNEVIVTAEGRHRYFEFLVSDGGPACDVVQEEYRIDQRRDTVTIGGIYTFCFRRPGGEEIVPARFMFTFEEVNGHWLICGHHSSRFV
ncbi:nuclear transport factor 2 family protein [Labrenzia sp. CE80]|uniref:nuclear transport factor 2 family protein n=1 Tax=Labrenzia sp. CE80 TaxID=1788986 RepID=UPI00129B8983|nr:nuclear transport factor 2 family protein [Labrenzia sp. CE80]